MIGRTWHFPIKMAGWKPANSCSSFRYNTSQSEKTGASIQLGPTKNGKANITPPTQVKLVYNVKDSGDLTSHEVRERDDISWFTLYCTRKECVNKNRPEARLESSVSCPNNRQDAKCKPIYYWNGRCSYGTIIMALMFYKASIMFDRNSTCVPPVSIAYNWLRPRVD